MAMQPALAATIVTDKIPFQWYNPQQQHHLDAKEGFLMWLRGEFAAANAIIDALCHHLRAVGEPGEYDNAVGCIEQRRCNWIPVLNMQQYFPVAEVVNALQKVGWRRQQLRGGSKRGGRGGGQKGHFSGQANDGGQKGHFTGETNEVVGPKGHFGGVANEVVVPKGHIGAEANGIVKRGSGRNENGEKKECNENSEVDSSLALSENAQATVIQAEDRTKIEGSFCSDSALQVKRNHELKNYVASEIFDGKTINVAEGMKLYEDLFTDLEVSKLISVVNDLRTAGRKGQLQGQTYVVWKRPMKGHGREIIQLGVPVTDSTHEDESASKDQKTEAIPQLLLNTIESLLTEQVLTTKPDTCFIDIFNEGDHSHPHMWPQWYGRPVCMLFLTDCDMTFGKVITVDSPGDYRGALKISLSPGSVLVMQGKSADFSRHAIPSLKKQRILVTLLKSLPKTTIPHVSSTPPPLPPSHWAPPPPIRPANHVHPSMLPPPTTRPQMLPLPNGIQPIFVPAQVIAYPPPPTRHPQPMLPVLGTGVFFPPQGSGNPPNQTVNGCIIADTCKDVDGSGSSKSNATSHENCKGNLHGTSEQTTSENRQENS